MQVPRIRYEVVSRNIMKGESPPVADAGPDQIGVPAGTITLNGSNSHDPNGLALTFNWVQETGPAVNLSSPTQAITTFGATSGQDYEFRLTVTNTVGLSASARVRVTTTSAAGVQILFFNANPTSIQSGQASQLSYRVLNATKVTISGIGTVNSSNGTLSVSPTTTTTYTLTAMNSTSTQSSTATVTVSNPQVQILTCTATPMNIIQGESATIVYATVNATSVTVSNGVGSVSTNGSFVVSPTTTTSYTITAANAGGSTTCSVSVQVTPGAAPQIIRFTANPTSITQGATSTLVWQVQNATTVTITPGINSVPLIGTQDVTPQQTQTYTLTATNSYGSVNATATITVTPPTPPPVNNPPSITSFTANPPVSPSPGSPVVLTCLAKNASSVSVSGAPALNANGSVTVNPQTTTTYQCTATGSGGPPATASVTVQVTQSTPTPPTIIVSGLSGLSCSAPVVAAGGSNSNYICQTVVRQVQINLSQFDQPGWKHTPYILDYLSEHQGSGAKPNLSRADRPIGRAIRRLHFHCGCYRFQGESGHGDGRHSIRQDLKSIEKNRDPAKGSRFLNPHQYTLSRILNPQHYTLSPISQNKCPVNPDAIVGESARHCRSAGWNGSPPNAPPGPGNPADATDPLQTEAAIRPF